ncbi:hypothetical protein S40288_11504 [Stachybotrys chartarum IBT 40288]|nr:hypothetical protein S40288_11504 [Stachybotrys chartarum IBT 40288]
MSDNAPNESPRPVVALFSFEIHLLVARKRPPTSSNEVSSDDSEDYPHRNLWVCPVDAANPWEAIQERCRLIFHDHKAPYRFKVYQFDDVGGQEYRDDFGRDLEPTKYSHWTVGRSETAVAFSGAPREYLWCGICIRSPFLHEADLDDDNTTYKKVVSALRRELRIHVNSTCRHHVLVRPDGEVAMDMVMAKKLTALVLMTERAAWNLGPYSNAILEDMHQYIPIRLRQCEAIIGLLYLVWRERTMEGLRALCGQMDERETSFSILPETTDPPGPPAAEFRYANWHPFPFLDTFDLWNRLAVQFMKRAALGSEQFRRQARVMDVLILIFRDEKEGTHKVLAEELGLKDFKVLLELVIEACQRGHRLDPERLDSSGFLVNLENFDARDRN